jgi:uncharacterized Zn-finger protein
MSQILLCPLCGKALPEEKFRQDYCWLSCSNCNVIFPIREPKPQTPVPQPENVQYSLERTETSLILTFPPRGHWAGWNRNAVWCATILGHLSWMFIFVFYFCTCFGSLPILSYYFSETWCTSVFLIEMSLIPLILYVCADWYSDWLKQKWKQNRFRFHSDYFSVIDSDLLERSTNEYKRSEIISIRVVHHRVCINRTLWRTEISTESGSEARRLAYEIETFYRSHPPQSETAIGIMDQLFLEEIPVFAVHCPACGERFHTNGECFQEGQSIKCQYCSNSFSLSHSNHSPTSTSSIPFVSKRNDKNRIKVSQSKRLEILAQEEHGWKNRLDNLILLLSTVFLSMISCYGLIAVPFIDLYQSGIFTLSFHDISYDSLIVISRLFWSVPIGMFLILLFFQGALWMLKTMFRKWKLVLINNRVEYSFGAFRKTVRVYPLTASLRFEMRNGKNETKKLDPENPATKEPNAVTIYFGDNYLGELPCADSDEVRRLCAVLNEFRDKNVSLNSV